MYDVDALACPSRQGRFRVIAAITSPSVAKKILTHVGLSEPRDEGEARPRAPASERALSFDFGEGLASCDPNVDPPHEDLAS